MQEESPSALRILEEDNKKLKEELVHISISLQHSKKEREREAREAGENSGKERKRIDELEAIQVRKGLTSQKSVLGQRETRLRRGLKRPQGWFVREVSSHLRYTVCLQKVNRFLVESGRKGNESNN